MSLELERRCENCKGRGTLSNLEWADEGFPAGPDPMEPGWHPCFECKGTGKVLTADGKVVEALVSRILDARRSKNWMSSTKR